MSIFSRLTDIIETAAPYVAPLIPGAGAFAPAIQAASTAEITRRAQKTAVQAAQAVSAPTQEQAPQFAMETPMSGGLVSTQDFSMYTPRFPVPRPSGPAPTTGRTMGDLIDLIPDITIFTGGGDTMVCGPQQKALISVRTKPDGSQCLSVTRKQQHQLKQMVMYLGIEGAADVLSLNVRELAMLLVKKFPPRRKGISAAQLRNAKRVNRTIMGMAKQLTDSCKTTARRR
jgi:hypothetical protein